MTKLRKCDLRLLQRIHHLVRAFPSEFRDTGQTARQAERDVWRLEKPGLVERVVNPFTGRVVQDDGGYSWYKVSDAGRALLKKECP